MYVLCAGKAALGVEHCRLSLRLLSANVRSIPTNHSLRISADACSIPTNEKSQSSAHHYSPLLGLNDPVIGSALGCECVCACAAPLPPPPGLLPILECLPFEFRLPTSCLPIHINVSTLSSPASSPHGVVQRDSPSQHARTFSTRSASCSCRSITARKSSALPPSAILAS